MFVCQVVCGEGLLKNTQAAQLKRPIYFVGAGLVFLVQPLKDIPSGCVHSVLGLASFIKTLLLRLLCGDFSADEALQGWCLLLWSKFSSRLAGRSLDVKLEECAA